MTQPFFAQKKDRRFACLFCFYISQSNGRKSSCHVGGIQWVSTFTGRG